MSFRKGMGKACFHTNHAAAEAQCVGWIESRPNRPSDERSTPWFAPRGGRSGCLRPNQERVGRLIEAGLLQPAGLAMVEQAAADGSWSLPDAVEDLQLPPAPG